MQRVRDHIFSGSHAAVFTRPMSKRTTCRNGHRAEAPSTTMLWEAGSPGYAQRWPSAVHSKVWRSTADCCKQHEHEWLSTDT
eukprot:1161813-Pelagomonas_calceolata.AAC.4